MGHSKENDGTGAVGKVVASAASLQSRFRDIVENAPEEISLKDTEGRYLLVNSRFEKLAGIPANEIIGRTSEEIFGRSFAQSGIEHDREVVAARKAIEREEVFRVGARERDFLTTKFPVFDDEDNVVAVGAIHVDLTQRNAAEKMKNEFVSMINHELRTPLTAIQGALRMLESGVLEDMNDKSRQLVAAALRNADRMFELISDLLDAESINAGKLSIAFEQVDPTELLRNAVADMEPVGDRYGVTFRTIADNGLPEISADPGRLTQVIVNLLSNAARFSGNAPEVAVRLGGDDTTLRLSVEDRGIGIPNDFEGDLFEPFVQVDGSNTRQSGGTGLGLSISKAIVEAHGGTIGYTSEEGVGSTFFLELPVSGPKANA